MAEVRDAGTSESASRGVLRGLGVPHVVDAQGAARERPTWGKLAALPLYVLAMLVLAVGMFAAGQPVVGVVFVALGVVPTVGVALFASAQLPLLVGRFDAEGAPGLGRWLGATRRELEAWAPTLLRAEVDVLEANRSREAEAVGAWLAEAGEPERVEVASADGARLVGHVLAPRLDGGVTGAGEAVSGWDEPATDESAAAPAAVHGGVAPEGPECWVVLAHGYGGTWRDGLLHARRYAERGYHVLLVDLRAHGESEGALVGLGWLDRLDLVAWCTWLAERAGRDARVVLHGTGMGAAAALLAAAEEGLPAQVRACVADSAYSDAWNVAVRLLSGEDGRQSAHPLVDLLRLALRLRPGGYDAALASPEAAVASSRVPVLLLQGDQDTVVAPYMAERLGAACGGAAADDDHQLVMFEGAGHAEAALADPVGYYWRTFTFLKRYV